ncbi:MAG: ABC transporter substrate-binding protein [Deltaproteobacteria bacterium]|nr:ABC transporter substrate-binding protein [Deltaproteobacteria bacterium]
MSKRILPLVACALLLSAAQSVGAAEVRGVTKDKIVTGAWVAMSGPLAYPGLSISNGNKAYFDYINDQGGIHGRKIEYVAYNDDFSPPKSVAAARKLVERDEVFLFANPMGTPTTLAALPVAKEFNVPIMNPGSGSPTLLKDNRLVFFCHINFFDQMNGMVDYLVKEKKLKKIAMFGAKGEIGEITRAGAAARLKKHGLELVSYDDASPDDVDVTAQFNKFRSAGADAVIVTATPKPASLMLQEMKKQNWNPVKFLYGPLTDQVPKMAREAAVGAVVYHWLATVDSNLPGVVEFRKIMAKYAPKVEINEYTLDGFVGAKVTAEILKRAGRDLTPEKFIAAAETLKDFDTGTGIKITFTPNDHSGSKYGAISVVKGPADPEWKTVKFEPIVGWHAVAE